MGNERTGIESADEDAIVSSDEAESERVNSNWEEINIIQKLLYLFVLLTNVTWTIFNPADLKLSNYISEDKYERYLREKEINTNADACEKSKDKTLMNRLQNILVKVFLFATRIVLRKIKQMWNLIMFVYFLFILIANLPFATISNFLLLLKCFTGSGCLSEIPFRLPKSIVNAFFKSFNCQRKSYVQRSYSKSFSNMSNSVNESNSQRRSKKREQGSGKNWSDTKKYIMLGLVIMIIYAYYYCQKSPDSGICKFNKMLKTRSSKQIQNLYMFPGKKCMKAGRCCKGYSEAIFRWGSCVLTIPIRIIVSFWPKKPVDPTHKTNYLVGVKIYVDKMSEELNELREDVANDEEHLINLQNTYIDLEQKVNGRGNALINARPKLMKSIENIDNLRKNLNDSQKNLAHMINVKTDTDKMFENVKTEVRETAITAKAAVSRRQTSIEAEQFRVLSQIKRLENILKEDQVKNNEINNRIMTRIHSEIEHVRKLQTEIMKRIEPLESLQSTYEELSNGIIKDLHNKLTEEKGHHEQMNKRTEKSCTVTADKLNTHLIKVMQDLTCYFNKTLEEKGYELTHKLRHDINNALHFKAAELSRITVEEAMSKKYIKRKVPKVKPIKKCGMLSVVPNSNVRNCSAINNYRNIFIKSNTCSRLTEGLWNDGEIDYVQDDVDEWISESLRWMTADNIGQPDFAMESAGGQILEDKSTDTYNGQIAILTVLGITLGKKLKPIRKVIQPGSLPGECWAFKGEKGHITIKLSHPVQLTAVTIDHVAKILTPTGDIPSAPKKFEVYGLDRHDDGIGLHLGSFEFDKDGESIQTFPINENLPNYSYQFVRINFLTNHGNKEYTCIYRIRVHGNYTVD